MDAEIFVSQHLHLDTPLTAKPLSWCYQVKGKWFTVKDWHSTGSVAKDSAVFVATIPVSQNFYWHCDTVITLITTINISTFTSLPYVTTINKLKLLYNIPELPGKLIVGNSNFPVNDKYALNISFSTCPYIYVIFFLTKTKTWHKTEYPGGYTRDGRRLRS